MTDNTEVANVTLINTLQMVFLCTYQICVRVPLLTVLVSMKSDGDISKAILHQLLAISTEDLPVSFNPNKATGSDNISTRALAVSAEALAVPLTNLISHCIAANA